MPRRSLPATIWPMRGLTPRPPNSSAVRRSARCKRLRETSLAQRKDCDTTKNEGSGCVELEVRGTRADSAVGLCRTDNATRPATRNEREQLGPVRRFAHASQSRYQAALRFRGGECGRRSTPPRISQNTREGRCALPEAAQAPQTDAALAIRLRTPRDGLSISAARRSGVGYL